MRDFRPSAALLAAHGGTAGGRALQYLRLRLTAAWHEGCGATVIYYTDTSFLSRIRAKLDFI